MTLDATTNTKRDILAKIHGTYQHDLVYGMRYRLVRFHIRALTAFFYEYVLDFVEFVEVVIHVDKLGMRGNFRQVRAFGFSHADAEHGDTRVV